jgi:hypothetical protein
VTHDHDNRTDPVQEMLTALRGNTPHYTDTELDAGFAAVLADLDTNPERVRQAQKLATEAELGADAHALGMEYLNRGDIDKARHWLETAARYGTITSALEDVRKLQQAVADLDTTATGPLPGPGALDGVDQAGCPPGKSVPAGPSTSPFAASVFLRDVLRLPEDPLRQARRRAEEIIAHAERRAEEIITGARSRAAAETASAAGPDESRRRRNFLVHAHLPEPGWRPDLRVRRAAEELTAYYFSGAEPAVARQAEVTARSYLFLNTALSKILSPAACAAIPAPQLLVFSKCLTASASAGQQRRERCARERAALHNLVGREAADAYRQALHERDDCALALILASDHHLLERFALWTHTADPGQATSVRQILSRTADSPTGGLLLPPGTRRQQNGQAPPASALAGAH